jgi:integrase
MHGDWTLKDAKNLRKDELDSLFLEARKAGELEHLAIVLAYNGALRVSELVHIKVSDFNWASGKLTMIPLKKAGKKRKKLPDGTITIIEKPLPHPVEYPLPSVVMEAARGYIKKEKLKGTDWLFGGFVSPGGCHIVKLICPGGHISKRKMQMIFDQVARAAKVKTEGRGIHSLKHGRLTEVAEKTKDPYLVKEMGRHSSIMMSNSYVKYVNLKEKTEEIGGRM